MNDPNQPLDELWSDLAYCANNDVDPSVFEMQKKQHSNSARSKLAKNICKLCDVQLECLEEGIRTGDQHAIYGGLTPAERKNIILFPE